MDQEKIGEIKTSKHQPSKLTKVSGWISIVIGIIGFIVLGVLVYREFAYNPIVIFEPESWKDMLFIHVLLLAPPSLFFLFIGRYFLTRKKSALVLLLISIFMLILEPIVIFLPDTTIREGKNNCAINEDCVVFSRDGCPKCGCYNRNNKPIIIGGWINSSLCICIAPTSCECVNSKCEGRGAKIERIPDCIIENPDPDGYLLKICKYLLAHEDTINFYPANPSKYNIKSIENGEYSRWEDNKEITTEATIVRLDCCYMGDIAYIDKETKEVIGFSVGDQ